MFSSRYLKQKTLYYYTDIYIDSNRGKGFVLSKPLRVFMQFRVSNGKSYVDFLKSFFVLRFLRVLKTEKLKKANYLKKKQVNDWLALVLVNKALFVKSFWLSSSGFCTEFSLKNLYIFSVLEKVFSKTAGADLEKTSIAVRIFSNLKKWIFIIYQSIDK